MMEQAIVIIKAEEERTHNLSCPRISKSANDAVGSALLLDLDHRALTRAIVEGGSLGDHTVEGAAAASQPAERNFPIAGHRRELETICFILTEELFQLFTPLRLGQLSEGFSVELEQIENHEFCRRLLGELPDATFRWMQSQLQRLEGQRVAYRNDEFPVQQETLRVEVAEHVDHFGKVARQRFAGFGGKGDFILLTACEAAKAVPLGLIQPTLTLGQLSGEHGLHRRSNGGTLIHFLKTIACPLSSFRSLPTKAEAAEVAREHAPSMPCFGQLEDWKCRQRVPPPTTIWSLTEEPVPGVDKSTAVTLYATFCTLGFSYPLHMPQSRTVATAQIITGIAAGIALLHFLASIIIPFVIAFVLAVLVNALVRFIQKRWASAPAWMVSLLTGLVVIVSASAGILIMAQGAARIVSQGPALLTRLDDISLQIGRSLHLNEPLHIAAIVGKISVADIAGFLLSGMQGLFSGLLLMVVYFGFMLAGRKRISAKVGRAAGSSRRATTIEVAISHIAADIETYVWVQTITGLILTASATAVMLAVGLNNILFWAVIFFLLTFIPNIGVTIGSIAPSLYALIQFRTVWQAITIFLVIQVVATIVGNLIYPRLQARTQNIDPVATLLSLAFWSWLWGLPGAFLAVPMTLMSMMVFSQFPSTKWVAALLSNDGKPIFRSRRNTPPDRK